MNPSTTINTKLRNLEHLGRWQEGKHRPSSCCWTLETENRPVFLLLFLIDIKLYDIWQSSNLIAKKIASLCQ